MKKQAVINLVLIGGFLPILFYIARFSLSLNNTLSTKPFFSSKDYILLLSSSLSQLFFILIFFVVDCHLLIANISFGKTNSIKESFLRPIIQLVMTIAVLVLAFLIFTVFKTYLDMVLYLFTFAFAFTLILIALNIVRMMKFTKHETQQEKSSK